MLSEAQVNAAHHAAIAQSGPRKGRLKAQCPKMGTLEAAYWMGCMWVINPFKLSIFQMALFSPEQHEIFDLAKAATQDVVNKRERAKRAA